MTSEDANSEGLRSRLSRGGEDALGRVVQELLESPFLTGAVSRVFEAREKASQAQEVAMGALNLPSAGDLERLTRRVRSVSQRLEGVEDVLDRVEERLAAAGGAESVERRLTAIEQQLSTLATQLSGLGERLAPPAVAKQPAPAKPRTASRTRAAAAKKRTAAKPKAAKASRSPKA
jgi:hypothetical protein